MSTTTTTRRKKTHIVAVVGSRKIVIRRTASDRWMVRILGKDGKAISAMTTPFALETAKRKARKIAAELVKPKKVIENAEPKRRAS